MAKTKSFEQTIREDICMNIYLLSSAIEMSKHLGKPEAIISDIEKIINTMQTASERVIAALNMYE